MECSKLVIAMIDGFCCAGALGFAMCCDIRFCSDASTFAAVVARFSNGIATMNMPWLIGQRCRSLIYTGDAIDSAEAFRLGLGGQGVPRGATACRRSEYRQTHVPRFRGLPEMEQAFDQPGVRDHGPLRGSRRHQGLLGSPKADTFDAHALPGRCIALAHRPIRAL